jgi:hypothetical protein
MILKTPTGTAKEEKTVEAKEEKKVEAKEKKTVKAKEKKRVKGKETQLDLPIRLVPLQQFRQQRVKAEKRKKRVRGKETTLLHLPIVLSEKEHLYQYKQLGLQPTLRRHHLYHRHRLQHQ